MPKSRMKRHAVTQPDDQSIRLIPLTQGQNALVDVADYEWLNQWNWCACWNTGTRTFYAERNDNGKNVKMHRLILNCEIGQQVDHRNHDTLDNRRVNLRPCTNAENARNRKNYHNNTTGLRGAYRDRGRWRASISVAGRNKSLGSYLTVEEAHYAYATASQKIYGAFAPNLKAEKKAEVEK